MSKVIVIDDMKSYCDTVCAELATMDIEAVACQTVKKAKWLIERAGRNDVVLCDLVLNDESRMSGTDILRWMRNEGHHQLFYLMTSYGTMENSIETMKLGAKSYIPKEQMDEKFYAKIKGIMEEQSLRDKRKCRLMFKRQSPQFRTISDSIKSYIGTDIRLTIIGESGTGRSHLAEDYMAMEGIHYGGYAHVNCGALGEMEHVEDYFFGHQKGAYAGAVQSTDGILEIAHDSFLFLENVDEMPMSVQNLLREVMETGEYCRIGSCKKRAVDFRLICTSTKSPDQLVGEGLMTRHFRDCICEEVVDVPPLRETKSDIPPMAQFFVEQFDTRKRKLSRSARHKLEGYHWPGNVRELVNVIKTSVGRCDSDEVKKEHLMISAKTDSPNYSIAGTERDSIIAALKRNGNNKSEAAKELGISRKSIYNKIHEYQIDMNDA